MDFRQVIVWRRRRQMEITAQIVAVKGERRLVGQHADPGTYLNNAYSVACSRKLRHFGTHGRVDQKILPERL
jgi:hypothetical protein